MTSMVASAAPSRSRVSPSVGAGDRLLCGCGSKLYRNRKRCVPCALGWTEATPETHAERRQRVLAECSARKQAESAARFKALAAAKNEREERARLLTKIARDDAHRESMPARLAAIRAAATARQRAARGL